MNLEGCEIYCLMNKSNDKLLHHLKFEEYVYVHVHCDQTITVKS